MFMVGAGPNFTLAHPSAASASSVRKVLGNGMPFSPVTTAGFLTCLLDLFVLNGQIIVSYSYINKYTLQ